MEILYIILIFIAYTVFVGLAIVMACRMAEEIFDEDEDSKQNNN
jgi:hypothetical protein